MTIAEQQGNEFAGYFNTTEARGEARGRAEGEAKAVLMFLTARGVEVPDEYRDRITSCNDLVQLDEWIARAATATTIRDLFPSGL